MNYWQPNRVLQQVDCPYLGVKNGRGTYCMCTNQEKHQYALSECLIKVSHTALDMPCLCFSTLLIDTFTTTRSMFLFGASVNCLSWAVHVHSPAQAPYWRVTQLGRDSESGKVCALHFELRLVDTRWNERTAIDASQNRTAQDTLADQWWNFALCFSTILGFL